MEDKVEEGVGEREEVEEEEEGKDGSFILYICDYIWSLLHTHACYTLIIL